MGLFDSLSGIPIFGSLFDQSNGNQEDAWKDALAMRMGLDPRQHPEYQQTHTDYKPEDYTAAQYSEDPAAKTMQMGYLSKLAGLSDQGLSDEDKEGFEQAGREGNSVAQAQTQSALQDASRRGVAGGGMEFALREMGNQGGAERARQDAMGQAAQASRQRALYNQAYGSALSGYRNQNNQVGMYNNNLINQFNQMNTQQHNQAQLYNQQDQNRVKQQNYDNAMGWAGGAEKDYGGLGNAYNNIAGNRQKDRTQNQKFVEDFMGMGGSGGGGGGGGGGMMGMFL